ncbi:MULTISPECIES: 2'-5' RNA ligase family protein [unclassified Nocardioides]|uniref:2'-5' RNA ligase family protein n=1 Tax=unclassified Nocardioides TaxID=2615069 RepID=UPI00361C0341
MALAVCLLFDGRSERLVRELWSRLEAQGVHTLETHTHRRHRPHLSYAVLRAWDLERVRDAVTALPDDGEFLAEGHGSVLFPRGRIALAVSIPAAAAVRQERVVAALASTGADLHQHYRPGHWIPHVSAATHAPRPVRTAAVATIADTVPMGLTVARAALIDSATGETWPLPTVP